MPAHEYIQAVREHYRHGAASYQGNRNEDQRLIAELAADEARLLVDGAMAGIVALGGAELPYVYEKVESAGLTWTKFRSEFERLMAGFGVITNRLNRGDPTIPSYIELDEESRAKVGSALLADFLEHNALRFGVDSSGISRTARRHNDEGEIEIVRFDPDKTKWDTELERNIKRRGLTSTSVDGRPTTHAAGKLSPREYKSLRKEFPEYDKDTFDQIVGSSRNARKVFEESND